MTPAELEIARHALAGVAEEMGVALRRAASSPNIKERVDCSAAVFDARGAMAAQAEHIPVHLGAMPASVRAVLDAFDLAPSQQAMVNDPYAGGTHLPDLTIVAAVGDGDGTLLGYVANRAHHADVGGAAPGSMPASATDIAMEGTRIPPVRITDPDGTLREDVLGIFAAGSRTPRERWGDLRAQLAANHVGARRLREVTQRLGGATSLAGAMQAVQDYADRRVRAAIAQIPDGCYVAEDALELDHPARIRAAVTVDGDRLRVDFAGSSPQVPVNVNAVLAVTTSATWFVVRLLTDPDAPPNQGCYRAVEITAPEASLVHATFPAPTAAGNVETSQRIVDVLLAAFAQALPDRVPAASQGTMNNLLLGSAQAGHAFSYYETIAGGEGGTPSRAGMAGVHTGMTNTRNTPAEALELGYPLRVRRAELRPGSGGVGRHPGGDGVVREVEVLTDCVLTLQTERRTTAPAGRGGGADGLPGRNVLLRPGEPERELPSKGTWALAAGDRIRVETPGGGGWGPPEA